MKIPRHNSCDYNFRSKLGVSLGFGRSRTAYSIKENPKYVIKYSPNPATNRHEYNFLKQRNVKN